ncbi:hypothetical protein CD351_09055 [Erythrobacter sp. KY5]|uniref:Panacea domain-containing protein n=1 Tax=Erythrobacter sp. KY5 TaxID=2011159 RepID=UPI000DBF2201|nr:type II toxin-antitoxin system antitoxin SocA domain-containing protein [Erythrobacter sp. KY5]AWW74572.1 hypothetical protein CD351_09055 [Erythrobacter sp. KY5]
MADVFDVSAYILKKAGPMTAMKLQKLVYYSQAWSLVWDESPLFDERIEAWANGPVCPDLYFEHQGQFTVSREPKGDAKALTKDERETVDAILKHYGNKRAHWLSDLTHKEDPWRNARRGLPDGVRSNRVISHASMAEFYGNL